MEGKDKLEAVLASKIEPLLDDTMKQFLGVRISEIKGEISDKILKSPLLGLPIAFHLPFKEAKQLFKQAFLRKMLQTHYGNISQVARLTGIDRRSIHRLVDKQGTQKIRDDLPKPYYLKQKEVEHIIDNVLGHYKEIIKEEKMERMYEAMPSLSKEITDELPDEAMSFKEAEEIFERQYLERKLLEHQHNLMATAKAITLRYETLLRKLKKLGIK